MSGKILVWLLAIPLLATAPPAEAQQAKVYRIGVLLPGDPWYEIVDGLRAGLRQLGLQEGKQFVLAMHHTKGDVKAGAEAVARTLEQEKADLIYTTSTGVTLAAQRATAEIPIVFCAGTDPVALGLVNSFAKSGGRLTGVYNHVTDLTPKRLEILKEMMPKIRRVITFYHPRTSTAIQSSRLAREAAARMGIEFVERHIASFEDLQSELQTLRVGQVDAYFAVSDALAATHAQLVIDAAKAKKLATMFDFLSFVSNGGLASYGVSFHEMGRLSAKYVQRVLSGAKPNDMPVEAVDKISLVINLKTAKQIGLTIPPNVLARADKVIQ